jgi:hypothetical protein
MTTLTTLRNVGADAPSTAERKINAETQLRRNLGITDSIRERVRTKLIDVPIEDSPIKRDRPRDRDEQVILDISLVDNSYCLKLEGSHLLLQFPLMIRFHLYRDLQC